MQRFLIPYITNVLLFHDQYLWFDTLHTLHYHCIFLTSSSLLLSLYDFTNASQFLHENFVLLEMHSAPSKNYLEVKCSLPTSKSYIFQKVRISRDCNISRNANILLSKENKGQKSSVVIFLWFFKCYHAIFTWFSKCGCERRKLFSTCWGSNFLFIPPLCLRQSSLQAVETRFIGYSLKKNYCKTHLKIWKLAQFKRTASHF